MAPKPKQDVLLANGSSIAVASPEGDALRGEPKVEAVTYYAKTDGKAWEVHRLEVLEGGQTRATKVVGPCSLLIARDRMRVLLSSPEVMP